MFSGMLSSCASMFGSDPLRVNIVGLSPLSGQGMETRFTLKLRVQNPNDGAIQYSGVSLDLLLNGLLFASGVSAQSGTVPRFGEAVIEVPMTVPALAAMRQALSVAKNPTPGEYPYMMRGRFATSMWTGGTRFVEQGSLSLSSLGLAGE
ncbi:LEA type 2 family protein [Paraburkholderia sp.]|uniref:LEA type 2 family protein n=1 Tax=Paraburkholderia sp. TaxID=1926495 RepID=UPI00238CC574|nr:LEA type 2 family protein [Paraburkholderia sp.]MDE1184355.1 LEA type 2 family protein [Paraburkholderia sp.]